MTWHVRAMGIGATAALLLAGIDQLVKGLVVRHLAHGESRVLVPGFLDLTNQHNYGAAFSLLKGAPQGVVLGLSVVVLAGFLVLFQGVLRYRAGIAAAALIVGGAIGNLIDRIHPGYVVDYLDLYVRAIDKHIWPVFNLADIFVVVGVGVLLVTVLRTDAIAPTPGGESS